MPLPANGFTFKQFFIAHDRCAMKVNTDAIILGAWADVCWANNILDIGTGSGIIALMAAQRALDNAVIDAIELEPEACKQAKSNFERSPWHNRIREINQSIINFSEETIKRYDVILSNPPYFSSGVKCYSSQRNQARYTESLSHEQLLLACRKLLTPKGAVYLVLPYSIGLNFLEWAESNGWFCGRKLIVRDSNSKPAHLLLFELALYPLEQKETVLTIRNVDRQYSEDFRRLTRDFYLFF